MSSYFLCEDFRKQIAIQKDAIVSKTVHRDEHVKVVLFAFGSGQELSQHTAAVPAIVEILQGEARVTIASDEQEMTSGGWLYMQPHVTHAIYARTDLFLLLTMLTGSAAKSSG